MSYKSGSYIRMLIFDDIDAVDRRLTCALEEDLSPNPYLLDLDDLYASALDGGGSHI